MPQIDVLLRTRRRSVTLQITPQGNLVVRAPINFPFSKIEKIVEQKQSWIQLHQSRILQSRIANVDLFNYNNTLYLGVSYPLIFSDNTREVQVENGNCLVPLKWQKSENQHIVGVAKWLKNRSHITLEARVAYFSTLMQLEPGSVRLSNASRSWGSCDKKGNLKFNFRLVMLPPKLIDYVVVHELSHILEFNHSPDFWEIVSSLLPDFKQRRADLKKGDYLLQLYR